MSNISKPKRAYKSDRRQAQARQTRQQIANAARKLFVQRGYSGATIEAISQEANVSPKTVAAIFGSKRLILSHLLDISIGGDDEPIRLLDRPEPQAVFAEKNQRRQFQMFAPGITSIINRTWPMSEILFAAAKTEPDIAELRQHMENERWHNMYTLVEHVAANGPLRENVSYDQAADTLFTLTSFQVFRLLTGERGWSNDQYAEWLTESLIRLLLP